jgi:uncharacterized membrane protein YfcA
MSSFLLYEIGQFLTGLLISLIGSTLGIGGGLFLIPLLTSIFKVEMKTAVVLSSQSLLFSSFITTLLNLKKKHILYKLSFSLEAFGFLGTLLGATLISIAAPKVIQIIFMLFLGSMAYDFLKPHHYQDSFFLQFLKKINESKPTFEMKSLEFTRKMSYWSLIIVGFFSGLLGSLLGIGGGIVKTPLFIKVLNLPKVYSLPTIHFTIFLTSLFSVFSHSLYQSVDPKKFLSLLGGFGAGALLAFFLGKKVSTQQQQRLLGIILMILFLWSGFSFVKSMT